MVIVYIKKLAITGCFGPVYIGMSRGQVTEALGQPDGEINLGKPGAGIHYSRYEFFFNEAGRLAAIQNDHCDPNYPEFVEYERGRFQVDPWILRSPPGHTLESARKLIEREGLPHATVEYFGRTVIQFPSKVILDFDDERDHRPIVGFRYFPEKGDRTTKKERADGAVAHLKVRRPR